MMKFVLAALAIIIGIMAIIIGIMVLPVLVFAFFKAALSVYIFAGMSPDTADTLAISSTVLAVIVGFVSLMAATDNSENYY